MINKLNKQILRKQLLDKRRSLSYSSILYKSNKITEQLMNLKIYQQSENVMLYLATKSEVQTNKIIKSAQKDNKKIFIPLIVRESHELFPSLVKDFDQEVAPGNLQILEPKKEFQRIYSPHILDLIIVPGIAFTLQGHRLGRGGGYYDRFLSQVDQHTYSIALAFELQMMEEIPIEKTDMPVHCIITEQRVIRISQT